MTGDAGMTEIAGIYCRLSLARFGDTTKVDDQERICRDLAAERGWYVPDEYVWKDNNKSAWRIGVRREGWEAMLAAVEAGQLRNLVTYHGDRMVRQPYDLEMLIRLVRGQGVTITSPTGTRHLDVAEDVAILGILANMARLESENISRRKKAGFERMRLQGIPPVPGGQGHRAFGYQADGQTLHPVEAEALRSAARRLLNGETLAAICRDLTAAGIRSTTGHPLNYSTLRRILLRPRTAGFLSDGSRGRWEPALDPAVQRNLAALFATVPPREPSGAKYLLSGIAVCSECERPVQITYAGSSGHPVPGYGCVTPGCRRTRRNAAALDNYITGRIVGYLNSPAVTERMPEPVADTAADRQIAALEARLAEANETMATLADHPGVTSAALHRSITDFEQRIAVLRAQAASPRSRILSSRAGITVEEFKSLPLGLRRQLVSAAYRITVLPASRMGPGFREEDVRVELRED
ncbi:MAG: recombinase family protein [Actinobacteria bacterium]|nr:recombinase family protein [Actinomycetota bacterium]